MRLKGLLINYRECIIGSLHFLRLKCFPHSMGRSPQALLLEVNPFHGEVLPGYADYLQKLGFEVTVLTRYSTYRDSPFCRMEKQPRHYCLTPLGMRLFLTKEQGKGFDFILYASSRLFLFEYRFLGTIATFWGGYLPEGRQGYALIEHDLNEKQDPDINHLFLLTKWNYNGHMIPMCNPHTFGKCLTANHKLKSKRVFITVGKVVASQRDFNGLTQAMKHLAGDYDFELWIVGIPKEKSLLSLLPEGRIKILGRLSFARLYDAMEMADFFLPLLEPETHAKYLRGCTSGSRQLVMGFNIPPIMHEAFAEHYGFTKDSCLTYTDDATFADALFYALNMDEKEYECRKSSLEMIAQDVYRESLDNLKGMIAT